MEFSIVWSFSLLGRELLVFRQSVVVLVWSTTVLPNVRLMPSLRLMHSTEPNTLLVLPQKQKR